MSRANFERRPALWVVVSTTVDFDAIEAVNIGSLCEVVFFSSGVARHPFAGPERSMSSAKVDREARRGMKHHAGASAGLPSVVACV